jgi:hypothetical protein
MKPKNPTGYKPYEPCMGRGGFEPDADVLVRSAHCARLSGFKSATPFAAHELFAAKWVGADLNRRPPPCQGGVITSLDHQPAYH